ncbi:ABC transporter permease [Arcticibacter tournemirensis]|uniref:FtsX-like permease family protein n=1 Tax=Arcticibacter tournemirensis TaxID=699437 RepID=A0A4Q0M5M1_9SPHI|nr:ABC transporter permease [Arcticibacter tournemirensis]RXF68297.1 FtsX-like permease family protein [Arcticibacter tournemirensis]
MLKNFFTVALRNIRKNKGYAFINIVGLSLGICCALIIYILVNYHLSFDTFHKSTDRIYRVITEFHQEGVELERAVPQPLGKAFRNDFGFSEKTARIATLNSSFIAVQSGKEVKKFDEENGVAYAEAEFFEIFNFPLEEGDKRTALIQPNTALITRNIARKYFGKEEALGKTIKVNNKDIFTVTGVLKDLPSNSERKNEIFLSYDNLKNWNQWIASDSSWTGVFGGLECYTLLKKGVHPETVNKALAGLSDKYYDEEDSKVFRFILQPLKNVHFNTGMDGEISTKTLYTLSAIGVFLLIVACVNFINLATAQSLKRAKEVGVRKVLGSSRKQIFWQFIAETFIIVLTAWILSFLLAGVLTPLINQLLHSNIAVRINDSRLLFFSGITFVLVVFISGFYPGLIQSAWRPAETLKGQIKNSGGSFSIRKMLVTVQFAIVQMLIIGVIVIAVQMHYATTTDMGFTKEGIVILDIPHQDKATMKTLKNKLAQLPGVESISFSLATPASNSNNVTGIRYNNREKTEPFDVNAKQADENYLTTYGIKLVAGRNIFASDTIKEFLVNETLVRKLKLSSPLDIIGKRIFVNGDSWKGTVVGVVKDFYNHSFHTGIEPVCIMSDFRQYRKCGIKVNLQNLGTLLPQFEKTWNSLYSENIYSSTFLDDDIRKFYEKEQMMLHLVELFAAIAIFIGCLGLYGLVSFMALQRTREIGVRKVLGASENSIIWLFGKEFTILVLLAFVIAAPLAGWVMHHWLQNFVYHIPVNWLIFLISIVITLVITALTVGYRSVRAARSNPVQSLRME